MAKRQIRSKERFEATTGLEPFRACKEMIPDQYDYVCFTCEEIEEALKASNELDRPASTKPSSTDCECEGEKIFEVGSSDEGTCHYMCCTCKKPIADELVAQEDKAFLDCECQPKHNVEGALCINCGGKVIYKGQATTRNMDTPYLWSETINIPMPSRRDYFAAMAMQAFIIADASRDQYTSMNDLMNDTVIYADYLIDALDGGEDEDTTD